ncbi:hypothetical protein [Parenemella sanctibonifatiensis]|uniref:Uncharacterized protein n=1 Tax=Parenemella sanctibonifatiensis TaxID=2016505 RepID=A0A255DZ82_9ACTN|nr:hypothetical protein [Parenemella sanctibonifatiensis]OYN84627.1 hypothetical protein CGZ92_12390 [Parenemella sanctibonifatiensis]
MSNSHLKLVLLHVALVLIGLVVTWTQVGELHPITVIACAIGIAWLVSPDSPAGAAMLLPVMYLHVTTIEELQVRTVIAAASFGGALMVGVARGSAPRWADHDPAVLKRLGGYAVWVVLAPVLVGLVFVALGSFGWGVGGLALPVMVAGVAAVGLLVWWLGAEPRDFTTGWGRKSDTWGD